MSERIMYVSRITRLALVGGDGNDVGHIVDVVLDMGGRPPRVNGFVIGGVQRRRVFIGAGRVGEIETRGVRLRRGLINLRQFELRAGEKLASGQLIGQKINGRRVVDIGIVPAPDPFAWEVSTVALAPARRIPGIGRQPEVIDWSEAGDLFTSERNVDRQAATFVGMHPAQMAAQIRNLPLGRRRLLAEALEDDRLADLLEELPEEEQVRLIQDIDPERLGRVLDEMEADDAADLLGEMSAAERDDLLARMDPDEAEPVRRLLTYNPDTAGGLMTPEPIILPPSATVAQALARLRDPDLSAPLAAQIFVCTAPLETPTGRFHGVVGVQRLLREAASKQVGRCIDDEWDPVNVNTPDREVAGRLAAYDVVAVPVTDDQGRLLGAVTVDDVLDHVLPSGWRLTHSPV